MPPIPPLAEVLERLQLTIIPAMGMAALFMCLIRCMGKWASGLAAASAMVAAFSAANIEFNPEIWGMGRLIPWKPEDGSMPLLYLPRVALILLVAGLFSSWAGAVAALALPSRKQLMGELATWLPRIAASVAAIPPLIAEGDRAAHPWLMPAFVAVVLIEWWILDTIAQLPDSADAAAGIAGALFAASAVLLYNQWVRPTDIATIAACAMLGIAAAAHVSHTSAHGAMPAVAVALPGLMLQSRLGTASSPVLLSAFWLVALAPLALAPFLIPRLARQTGWRIRTARVAALLIPATVAVVLAARDGMLPF